MKARIIEVTNNLGFELARYESQFFQGKTFISRSPAQTLSFKSIIENDPNLEWDKNEGLDSKRQENGRVV